MSRRTAVTRGRSAAAGIRASHGGVARTALLAVSGTDGVYVVHRQGESCPVPADAADSLRDGPAEQATVLVGVPLADEDLDELARRLAPVLEERRARGLRLLRLAMSGGAVDRVGAPAPARRICEDWGIDVVAPSGIAVVVPGGTLFAPHPPDAMGGWWHFSPGRIPQRLGARLPAPAWEGPLERIDPEVAEGHLVEPVPAGLLVQPLGAQPEGVDAIRYAVPADPARPVLLVGSPGSPPVSADALAGVLAALPGQIREAIRLVPGDGRDLLPVGQEVADALALEVQVGNGLPVLLAQDPAPGRARTLLVGADGMPSWQPYVEAVTCVPADGALAPAPRVGSWRPPATGLAEGPGPGVLLLDRSWQVTVTRAGLWVGPRGGRSAAPAGRSVDTEVMAIDLGVPGRALDESLWPALDRLFGALEDAVRDRAMIQVHGEAGAGGMRTLRRLAVRHGLALAPKGWRSGAAERSAAPVSPALPTEAAAPARRPVALTAAAAAGPPATPEPVSAPAPSELVSAPAPAVPVSAPAPAVPISAPAPAVPSVTASGGLVPEPPATASSTLTSSAPTSSAPTSMPDPAQDPGPAQDGEVPSWATAVEATSAEPPHPVMPPAPLFTTTSDADVDSRTTGTPEPAWAQWSEPDASAASLRSAPSGPPAPPAPPSPSSPSSPSVVPLRETTYVPIHAAHFSTPQERRTLRSYLGADWDRHVGAVQRALTRLPGLRSAQSQDELSADLAAVHAYVNAAEGKGNEHRFPASLERHDRDTLAFLACLASGLRRLPSFRGTVVRAAGVFDQDVKLLLPGEEIGEATPVSALAVDKDYPSVPDDHYLIWSVTGRRAGSLADPDRAFDQGEIVFGPGTRFRVLGVRERSGATVVLLRELPSNAPVCVTGRLEDSDVQVLDRLTATADRPASLGNSLTWPTSCTGALGVLTAASPGPRSPGPRSPGPYSPGPHSP